MLALSATLRRKEREEMAFLDHLLNARTLAPHSLVLRHPHFMGRDAKALQLGQA